MMFSNSSSGIWLVCLFIHTHLGGLEQIYMQTVTDQERLLHTIARAAYHLLCYYWIDLDRYFNAEKILGVLLAGAGLMYLMYSSETILLLSFRRYALVICCIPNLAWISRVIDAKPWKNSISRCSAFIGWVVADFVCSTKRTLENSVPKACCCFFPALRPWHWGCWTLPS